MLGVDNIDDYEENAFVAAVARLIQRWMDWSSLVFFCHHFNSTVSLFSPVVPDAWDSTVHRLG
jgi:hypothetical protein